MADARRYMLTQEVIDSWYTKDGKFAFRLGFDTNDGKTVNGPGLCPQITINETDVCQTTNATAIVYLQTFHIPQGLSLNGVKPPSGPVWVDVTDTHPIANVDLDQYFH